LKRIKDKDAKLKSLELKTVEMQEASLEQINQFNSELASQKSMSDHQVQELKKRIDEVEETS